MHDPSKPIEETAKAAQEIAKATGKAIDATDTFGGFVSRFVSGPLGAWSGLVEDNINYKRWENQQRLKKRAKELLAELNLTGPTRELPLKFALPLLTAASLEDEEGLQTLWANLLVNAGNEDSGIALSRAYIDILENIGSLEARILQTIYSLPLAPALLEGVTTVGLPKQSSIYVYEKGVNDKPASPSRDVELALSNLARLGCLAPSSAWGGGQMYSIMMPTPLGAAFVQACTLQRSPVVDSL